jgi:hypothetical protein
MRGFRYCATIGSARVIALRASSRGITTSSKGITVARAGAGGTVRVGLGSSFGVTACGLPTPVFAFAESKLFPRHQLQSRYVNLGPGRASFGQGALDVVPIGKFTVVSKKSSKTT